MKRTGLWIDHRKAVVVSVDSGPTRIRTLESEVEPRVRIPRTMGAGTPYLPQDGSFESRRERRHEHYLLQFYDRVLDALSGTNALFVMGPGAAKAEFRKRFEQSRLRDDCSVVLEPADRMSDAQVVEKVKAHFHLETRHR